MSGPYREAFVLLSDVAFEEAKALGEQFVEAIVAVAEKPRDPLGIVDEPREKFRSLDFYHPDVWIVIVKDVQDRFDWKLIGWSRREERAEVAISVQLPCGHTGKFLIDETKLMLCASPRDLLDHILDEIEKPPLSKCKCGKIRLGPAGRPS